MSSTDSPLYRWCERMSHVGNWEKKLGEEVKCFVEC